MGESVRRKRPSGRMLDFLRWLEGKGDVKQWPVEWGAIRRRATMDGMIESGGVDYSSRPFPVLTWRISDKGREVLASAPRTAPESQKSPQS